MLISIITILMCLINRVYYGSPILLLSFYCVMEEQFPFLMSCFKWTIKHFESWIYLHCTANSNTHWAGCTLMSVGQTCEPYCSNMHICEEIQLLYKRNNFRAMNYTRKNTTAYVAEIDFHLRAFVSLIPGLVFASPVNVYACCNIPCIEFNYFIQILWK